MASRLLADLLASSYEESLRRYARGRLLDLGCGKVPLYAAYRPYVEEAVCVDWKSNEHTDLDCDLSGPLPFEAAEFDTIILSDVLEHIPNPQHLCDEMARVLKSGGHLIMNVPFLYWLHECPHDYFRYTEFALRRFMEVSGMGLLELCRIGGAPEVVADIVAKNLVRVPAVGMPMAVSVQWLTWRFVRSAVGKGTSARSAAMFPLGYFVVARKSG